jgi:hypothetical protein
VAQGDPSRAARHADGKRDPCHEVSASVRRNDPCHLAAQRREDRPAPLAIAARATIQGVERCESLMVEGGQ